MTKSIKLLASLLCLIILLSTAVFASGNEISVEQLLGEFKLSDINRDATDIKNDIFLPTDDTETLDGIINLIKSETSNKEYYDIAAELFATNKQKGIFVFSEGSLINFALYNNVQPVIVKDRTMVPARAIAESLGAIVDWNDAQKLVTIQFGEKIIILTIDSQIALVDGKEVKLDVPAQILTGGRTVIPLRFVSESFGKTVGWHPYTGGASVVSIY